MQYANSRNVASEFVSTIHGKDREIFPPRSHMSNVSCCAVVCLAEAELQHPNLCQKQVILHEMNIFNIFKR